MSSPQQQAIAAQTEKELATKEVQYQAAVAAAKGGSIFLATGLLGAYTADKFSPAFRRLRVPVKVAAVTMFTVAGASFFGEKAVEHNTMVRKEYMEQGGFFSKWDYQAKPFIQRHRWQIVGGAWVGCLAGSLALSMGNPHLLMSQKLIHARLYAQFSTIGVLCLTALLAQVDDEEEKKDRIIL